MAKVRQISTGSLLLRLHKHDPVTTAFSGAKVTPLGGTDQSHDSLNRHTPNLSQSQIKKSILLNKKNPWLQGLLMVAIVMGLQGCSYRTPATKTPATTPDVNPQAASQTVDKSFFFKTENGKQVPKSFVCGWASLTEAGVWRATHLNSVNMTDHCNLQFEINENFLVGRQISPSFLNEPHRWKQMVVIPIVSHFYFERAKDAYGRDTNEYIENSARSDWRARPKMKLDLSRMQVLAGYGPGGMSATGVSDIEWDFEKGFLGFNANLVRPGSGDPMDSMAVAESVQTRVRFNFLAFEHNSKFEPTPYSDKNARFFNALHILGRNVEGVTPILYAARWDTTKVHDLYMYGFPKKYEPIAEESVKLWNDAFEKIGQGRPFRVNKKPMKYPFDLRYPMMVWVEDKEISERSPLGIAMNQADVRNGEMLWGGVVMWGGAIESYAQSYQPSATASESAKAAAHNPLIVKTLPLGTGSFSPDSSLPLPPGLQKLDLAQGLSDLKQKIDSQRKEAAQRIRERLSQLSAENQKDNRNSAARTALIEQLRAIEDGTSSRSANEVANQAVSLSQDLQIQVQRFFSRISVADLFGFLKPSKDAQESYFGTDIKAGTPDEFRRGLLQKYLNQQRRNRFVADTERTFAHVAAGWAQAVKAKGSTADVNETIRNIVKELILHELGHFVGLGHQFKENVMPEKGSVPAKYFDALEKKAKEDMSNYTSVMGYKHPSTEVHMHYDEISFGPQDLLTLRYLYNREFPIYNGRDEDFTFVKLKEFAPSGEIPRMIDSKPGYRTAFFPACNDFDASLALDPYCNRFDRGYDAETIVRSYIENLNANLISMIYAFSDSRGGNTEWREMSLAFKAYDTLGRVRLFYDYMRQKYQDEIAMIARRPADLYEFSRACSGEITSNSVLNEVFKNRPGFKELCRVNRMALREISKFLVNPGPDFSEMDYDNRYFSASQFGDETDVSPDRSRAFGTHRAVGIKHLKFAALNALTTPSPYAILGGWLFPIPRYSDPEAKYSYSTLYPLEFTQAMAATVDKNLKFATQNETDQTIMGRAVLAMGYFLQQMLESNDAQRFNQEYIQSIRMQTQYNFRMVAAIFTKVKRDTDPNRATKFTVSLYDFRTNKSVSAPEGYVLPGGRVLIRGPERTFVYPVSQLQFLDDDNAYALAYALDYEQKHDDVLAAHSVKATFEKLHKSALDACIVGQSNGLATFFNSQEDPKNFLGFEIIPGIAYDKEKQIRFLESVRKNFEAFNRLRGPKNAKATPEEVCQESLKGLGLLVSSAAVINGFWLPEAFDYLVK